MSLHNQKYVGRLAAAVTLAVALFQSGSMLGSIASATDFEMLVTNTTLDTAYANNTGWKMPYKFSKWFEYYNDSTDFKNNVSLTTTCAHNFTDWDNFLSVEATGVWVACHDDELPEDCVDQPSSPCHPVISYGPTSYNSRMRTVKINFAIYGLAILRLNFPFEGECVDYSLRKDPFSSCAFIKQDPLRVNETWRGERFTFDPNTNVSFSGFTIELIARFKDDFVMVDKVEATEYLLCGSSGDGEFTCATTPTTTRTTATGPSIMPTTTTERTTTEEGITDDYNNPTTKAPSSSTRLQTTTALALTLIIFTNIFR